MKLVIVATALMLATACMVDTDMPPDGDDDVATTEQEILTINLCALKPWRSCRFDSECNAGEWCWFGTCRINPTLTRCESDTVSRNAAGDREDCGGYRCNPATGKCFTSCTTSNDCSGSTNCNLSTGQCGTLNGTFFAWSTKIPLASVAPDRETSTFCSAKSCTVDADCGNTFVFMCKNGKCLSNVPHCTADRRAQVNWLGVSDCSPTTCSDIDGTCLSQCYSSLHCQDTACQMDPAGTCGW